MDKNSAMVAIFAISAGLAFVAIIMGAIVKMRGASKDVRNVTDSLQAMEQRFARVEVALDDMAAELVRVAQGQQFLTQALADRPRDAGALPVGAARAPSGSTPS